MDRTAAHMRITGLAITNDDVDSRKAAVGDLAKKWGKSRSAKAICTLMEQIAASISGDGHPSAELGKEVEAAVQEHASAFLYEDRFLEVGVCAGLTMLRMLDEAPTSHGWKVMDTVATALWLALSPQVPLMEQKREGLRKEVLNAARDYAMGGAERARERSEVGALGDLVITLGEGNAISHNFKKTLSDLVDALKRNASLDREEIDFLWWAQSERVRVLKAPWSALPIPVRVIACGVEAATQLRRLPAEVHRELVIRAIDDDAEMSLSELLEAVDDHREALVPLIFSEPVLAHPTIFPLLHALIAGDGHVSESAAKRKLSEWGGRALLENAFAGMYEHGRLDV